MLVGIVGDLHGNDVQAKYILDQLGERKVTHVFVVGDFGLWTHKAEGHTFLDNLNTYAEGNNLSVFAVGGNHENWDHWNWFVGNMPTHKRFAFVRRRVLLAPKVSHFTLAHRTFVIAGGAVSIDKDIRLRSERGDKTLYDDFGMRPRGGGSHTEWWPDEELTDRDVRTIQTFPEADILLTHDCSNYTHFQGRLKPDMDSERHRSRIDNVLRATKPAVHFHGHMHTKYDWLNTLAHGDSAFLEGPWTGPATATYGLEADFYAMGYTSLQENVDNWGVLDTDTLEFQWQGAVSNLE